MADIVREAVERTLDFLRIRKRDYQLTFGSMAGAAVLTDLAKFCRASESCYHDDSRLHAVLEGRREVWLRIQRHLNLQPEELMQIYAGRQVTRLVTKESDDD